jgi:hypothetical protein
MMKSGAEKDLASEIEKHIQDARGSERNCQIILDLDGTLFDNVPRTKQILLDQAERIFGKGAEIIKTISGMSEKAFEYNPVDTLKKHGIEDDAVLVLLREAWAIQFFGSAYLSHDIPVEGAVEAARVWWERGAELNYLTGRHVPEMFLGTCRSLHDAGFPVGTIRTQLLMKPMMDLEDVAFKVETIPEIRRKGPIALIVDNDPRVLNPLSETVPEAISVMVRTLHPKDAPELREGIPVVEDFGSLLR